MKRKWWRLKIYALKIEVMGHDIHGCNSLVEGIPGTNIVGTYFSIYWRGHCKFSQILKLENHDKRK